MRNLRWFGFFVMVLVMAFLAVFAAGAADMITAREATNIAEHVVSTATGVVCRVDGAARVLPKYLHTYDAADSYPAEAAEYYRSRGDGRSDGGCSAVRDGGFLCRNFDYPFDERAEFIVKMSAGPGRFASVGVAQVGTNLTEEIVTSGKHSPCYKWLPGATVDGVNERGVCAEINVVDGNPQTSGWHTGGDIHPLGAVRWALDNGTSAGMVASNLALRIAFPQGWSQNFHYMIADESGTWIVENGTAYPILGRPVMTNFRIAVEPPNGPGIERYNILMNPANSITNAWYTRAYRRETNPPWMSDFGYDSALYEAATNLWATKPKEQHRGEMLYGQSWWQTVHTSVYDLTNRVLRVSVQERPDWYVFQVPGTGGIAEELDPVALPRVTALETEVAGIPRITESEANPGWAANADQAAAVGDYDEDALQCLDQMIAANIQAIDEEADYRWSGDNALDARITETERSVESHTTDTNNPHQVTAAQVGAMAVTGGVSATGRIRFGTDNIDSYGNYAELNPSAVTVGEYVEEGAAFLVVIENGGITLKTTESAGIELTQDGVKHPNDDNWVEWPDLSMGGTFALISDIPPPPGDYAAVSNAAMWASNEVTTAAAAIAAETTRATDAETALQYQIDLFKSFTAVVTNSLPATGEDGCIYLVPIADSENKAEWLWVHEPSNHWEKIGTTAIDMAEYAKSTELAAEAGTRSAADSAHDAAIANLTAAKMDKVSMGSLGELVVEDASDYGFGAAVAIRASSGGSGPAILSINSDVVAYQGDVQTETDRATSAEDSLWTVLGDVDAALRDELTARADGDELNANAIAAETARATAAEAAVTLAAKAYTDSVLGPISTALDAILGGH